MPAIEGCHDQVRASPVVHTLPRIGFLCHGKATCAETVTSFRFWDAPGSAIKRAWHFFLPLTCLSVCVAYIARFDWLPDGGCLQTFCGWLKLFSGNDLMAERSEVVDRKFRNGAPIQDILIWFPPRQAAVFIRGGNSNSFFFLNQPIFVRYSPQLVP